MKEEETYEFYREQTLLLTEEYKELKERIDKVIAYLEDTKKLNYKHILARDNIIIHLDIDHIEYLLNILKGDDKE